MTSPQAQSTGWIGKWNAIPLYVRIIIAMVLGLFTGLLLGERALILEIPSKVILQLLGALAPPLILIAVTHVLMTTQISAKTAGRLAGLLLLNTTVAILIGLTVANVMKPGTWSEFKKPASLAVNESKKTSPVELIVQNIPKSIFGPLGDRQNVIGVIIHCRRIWGGATERQVQADQECAGLGRDRVRSHSHGAALGHSIGADRCLRGRRQGNWHGRLWPAQSDGRVYHCRAARSPTAGNVVLAANPIILLGETVGGRARMRDALVMAFSTDSSTATMPVTYACLKEKVGIREESASMGALVGANFNNDGTALYEAMAALFIAQLIGQHLTVGQQLMIVLTSIIASVGAAGIPEAGLVTMTLVFTAVGLPIEYIALLLTVDWFLDRCRTTINVLGDVNVSCILDGKIKPKQAAAPEPVPADDS